MEHRRCILSPMLILGVVVAAVTGSRVEVRVDWRRPLRTVRTAATVEVDVMPFLARTPFGGPFDAYNKALTNLGSEYVRFSPWYPNPRAVVPELRPPDCTPTHPATNWNSTVLDGLMADFMAAVCGPGAAQGACKLSVVPQLSTMPSWMYVGGFCQTGAADCLPLNPWNTTDPFDLYKQGAPLRDPSCAEMAAHFARIVGWYTAGGFHDDCGHWHGSGLRYRWFGVSVLNEDEHHLAPDDGTAYANCYDRISAAIAPIAPDIIPIGPEINGHGFVNSSQWTFLRHHLQPSSHTPEAAPKVASFHWGCGFDNTTLEKPFQDWDASLAPPHGMIAAIEATKHASTHMVLNEFIPFLSDWCEGYAPGKPCPDFQNPATCGGDPDLAHAKGLGINRATWSFNAAAAVFAYAFGTLAERDYLYVGQDQLVAGPWPDNEPAVASLDWQTGEPNAKYWVTQLLANTVGSGAEKTLMATNVTAIGGAGDDGAVYALAYLLHDKRGLLLVNKRSVQVQVLVEGAAGSEARLVEVDPTTRDPGFRPPVTRIVSDGGELDLGPLAVAVVKVS